MLSLGGIILDTTSNRLKYIMKRRNYKQVDILNLCKPYMKERTDEIHRNDLSQYISGKVKPGKRKLSVLSLGLNVNEAWLMGYDVPMEKNYWRKQFREWLKEIIIKLENQYGENVDQNPDLKKCKYMAANKFYYTYDDAQAVAHAFGTSIEEIVKQYGDEVNHKTLAYHPFDISIELDNADDSLIECVHKICGLDYDIDVTMEDVKKIELIQNFIQDNEKTLKKMMELLDK